MDNKQYSRRKFLFNGLGAVAFLGGMPFLKACNYLDVVPKNTPDIDSAFTNKSVMEKFLSTCYSHLPDPTNPINYPAYFTSVDEFDLRGGISDSVLVNTSAGKIARGLQNANEVQQDYWSGSNGGTSMYVAIRDCNIFLENADTPKDIKEEKRARWKAEVLFLKAYYHFFLMSLYGPIVLVKSNVALSDNKEEDLNPYREPVDTCVEYIVELLDKAIPDLPLTLPDLESEAGRVTRTVARGIKAKVLSWAASPLFNGNKDYTNWVDRRGKKLISSEYDPHKWEVAATAIKEAIDDCHKAGNSLYVFNKAFGGAETFQMDDRRVQEMTIRKAITADFDKNSGVIWATQYLSAGYKVGSVFWAVSDMLRMLYPLIYPMDNYSYVNRLSASWHMGELFYSKNGVPIEEDRSFDYANRFQPRKALLSDNMASYIPTGETTANLHFDREPRFYADLGFDRGYYELASLTKDGGKTFDPFLKHRPGEVGSLDITAGLGSYVPKKIIPYETHCSEGDPTKRYTPHDYKFPLLRLSDLYLLYSEALNEVKDQPDGEVYMWIDKVRENVGLKGVVESWKQSSMYPNAPGDKVQMREIIQKERLIELAFEGQRFWDVRRWKTADKYWSLPPMSWGESSAPEIFYKPQQNGPSRKVTFRDYLYPIRNLDLRVNKNLTQTYGW